MKNILIIGGAGYLGSTLSQKYLDNNYKITIIDSLIYKQGYLSSHILLNPNTTFLKEDISNISDDILYQHEIVFLLAAYVGPICNKYPIESERVNVEAVKNLVKRLKKDQSIVFACSSSGYGNADTLCNETFPFASISLYAKQKETAEKIVMEHNRACSARLATVWGRSAGRFRFDLLVNQLLWEALKYKELSIYQGNYRRCYINIDDVTNFFYKYAWNLNGIYNIAGDNCTKQELINKILEILPQTKITYSDKRDPDNRSYFLDCIKLWKATGFKCQKTLNNNLSELIDYYNILHNSCFNMESMRNV